MNMPYAHCKGKSAKSGKMTQTERRRPPKRCFSPASSRHPVRHHDAGAGRPDHHRVREDGLQRSAGVQTEGTTATATVPLPPCALLLSFFFLPDPAANMASPNASCHHRLPSFHSLKKKKSPIRPSIHHANALTILCIVPPCDLATGGKNRQESKCVR